MTLRILLTTSALALAATASAQELSARDTISDNHIVFPSSIDLDTHQLHDNWYLQRYAVLDSMASQAQATPTSDQEYIDRLQRLPNVIEMPFNSVVKAYIEMYANRKPQLVERMLGMSLYYMPIFEDALERYGMPTELRYLPIIESALDPNAVSKAGACGLWQFMASTATGEGLEVNSLVDQRRDPIAASNAAAHYLLTLYNMYEDWPLAIAAYNCGPGNVNKAIKRAGDKKDYWAIYYFLPEETRGYVPAFIAANYIMTYYADHGISHALARRPLVTDTVHVTRKVHLQQIADVMGLPIDEVRLLNPQYRADIIPGHIRPYTLTLPSAQAYCYVANEDSIINYRADYYQTRVTAQPGIGSAAGEILSDNQGQYVEELKVVYHKVKKGETINKIAQKYGVSVESIRKANNLSSNRVKAGKTLKINTYTRRYLSQQELAQQSANNQPVDTDNLQAGATAPASSATKPSEIKPDKQTRPQAPATTQSSSKPAQQSGVQTTYTVRSGDSLDKIGRKYGVTAQEIINFNKLKNSTIHPGQKLKIPAKKGSSKSNSSKSSKKKK